MAELEIRPMTSAEFDAYRERAIRAYAAEHVRAGNWSPGEAEELAAKETDDLLPGGVDTPGMLVLAAETLEDGLIGIVWVELEHRETTGAWIYDIEIVSEQRGRGYGRALLRAAEREVAKQGVKSIALNVFGGNAVARHLYESSGYEITSLHMRKRLVDGPDS
jgi:ribosomal protein S18 acetylase RimI-like enzyme